MAGLTASDLRRIKRFVETEPTKRTPHLLIPDDPEEPGGTTEDDRLGVRP
jgi:hypothetical protein